MVQSVSAYDTSFVPRALTPAGTTDVTLFTVGTNCPSADAQVLINATTIGAVSPNIRIGITPSGGSTFWVIRDVNLAVGDPIAGLGPYFLKDGDAIEVQTASPSDVTFSVTGSYST
jgi:hypothetical protein